MLASERFSLFVLTDTSCYAEAGPVPEVWDTAALCYHAVAVGSLEGLQLVKPQSLGMRTHDWDMLCKRSLQYGKPYNH